MSEPRVDLRAHVRVPIRLLDTHTQAPRMFIETVDLSVGGAFCHAPEHVPLSSQIRLQIELPDGTGSPPILVDAVVLRVAANPDPIEHPGGFLIALYFLNVRLEDRKRLQRFIFAHLTSEPAPP